MNLKLKSTSDHIDQTVRITGSKSESNRLLLLQALYPEISIENVSNSDDSVLMRKALETKGNATVDIHHAGTAMRFLTSYFAVQEGREVVLTGSQRMKERPIKILVDALRQLGADITYQENEGYPPLLIKGKKLDRNEVSMSANVSSQYLSSLLLIAPRLSKGMTLDLQGEITSRPYLLMTLNLLSQLGVKSDFNGNTIRVYPAENAEAKTMVVESDWSSASYFYSLAALSDTARIELSSYREDSLQGDSALAGIYTKLGVTTRFEENSVVLTKNKEAVISDTLELDLVSSPDIAQTIVVSCFGLGIACHLTGLHTLKIKETDRLEALKTELSKLGAEIEVTDHSLSLKASGKINENIAIDTYHDHRMAMAFAPLALRIPLIINDAGVVSKSYPDFWKDLEQLGIENEEL
ncbi:3-phosphoshikimate 1-carboxyvinyltransferase [Leptobacterium flavescens]|uniref:3-phosphoshikimate 1-carboxyvinyltransferase n=1 Tax=Leptobacterium flavescens TaxID=472055 RepID=A0A6P0UGS7_9FLAO|nr:3-phosphoshikimate 1-carboxyvinyltransferase [Leptobacterium flavescens]NER12501.1 3-phosphoshikimate 1-carboxyvinyltransferase [Leptobacterium flavescens]